MMQVSSNVFFLGVDGGGSKTLAIVVDAQGRERGRGLAGCANHGVVGTQHAIFSIHAAVEEAVQMAECSVPVCAAWLGLAGLDSSEDYDLLFPHLQPLAENVHLTNDAELILSALDMSTGVALIAGTGSIALGRDADGNILRTGGWGHILGDEGSGYDIGHQALQAAVRAADGRGEATVLLERILRQWEVLHASALIGQVYGNTDKARIARLSSIVFEAAQAGDEVACKIVQQAVDELVLAVITVGKALKVPEDELLSVALGGGLLVYESDFRTQVIDGIRHRRAVGSVAIVEQPALSAARAAIHL